MKYCIECGKKLPGHLAGCVHLSYRAVLRDIQMSISALQKKRDRLIRKREAKATGAGGKAQ